LKLFCLPYAGGSTAIYSNWKRLLNKKIELKPIELPGRGRKHSEPLIDTINTNSDIVINEIQNELLDSPYVLFGHSMGAEIVFRMLHIIKEKKLPEPEHLFFSGRKPPHLRTEKKYKDLSDEELIELLKEYGGTSDEFYEDPEVMSMFMPIIRNDFQMVDLQPIESGTIEPFNINFTILIGEDEDISIEEAEEWSLYTTKSCNIHKISGGHFFIDDAKDEVINKINETLFTIPVR